MSNHITMRDMQGVGTSGRHVRQYYPVEADHVPKQGRILSVASPGEGSYARATKSPLGICRNQHCSMRPPNKDTFPWEADPISICLEGLELRPWRREQAVSQWGRTRTSAYMQMTTGSLRCQGPGGAGVSVQVASSLLGRPSHESSQKDL